MTRHQQTVFSYSFVTMHCWTDWLTATKEEQLVANDEDDASMRESEEDDPDIDPYRIATAGAATAPAGTVISNVELFIIYFFFFGRFPKC